jgi:hypothetical protein
MPKPTALRRIARVLESDSQLKSWTERYRREAALTQLLAAHLPKPIADRVHVADTRNGVLEFAASAGAIATVLRQRAPDLLAALSRAGWDFTEIRVRVQVAGRSNPAQKSPKRQWDSASAAPLFDLAPTLPEGPLKAAIARWARRARGRGPGT